MKACNCCDLIHLPKTDPTLSTFITVNSASERGKTKATMLVKSVPPHARRVVTALPRYKIQDTDHGKMTAKIFQQKLNIFHCLSNSTEPKR